MQAVSFVGTNASPPVHSTRSISIGHWKGKVERQLSMDRSVVNISGSYSQRQHPCQVPVKSTATSTPWTPVPGSSPRQRTHSPLRWKGAQPVPAPAVVLTREAAEEASLDMHPDRLVRKKSLETTLRMPFLSMPSSQQPRQTPKRSSSPRQRTNSPSASFRQPSHMVSTKDNEDSIADLSSDRLYSSSYRSPVGARPVPRIASWHQNANQSSKPTPPTSPRIPSPFRWKGPQTTMPIAPAAVVVDVEDVAHRGNKVMIESSVASHSAAKAAVNPRSRVTRGASPAMRARTLSPARRPSRPTLSAASAVVVSKDTDDVIKASRATISTFVPAERDVRSQPRGLAASVAAPAKDTVVADRRITRTSAPIVLSRDEAEVLRRSAVVPPKDMSVLEPAEQGVMPSDLLLKPWLEAAANFELNTDFDLSAIVALGRVDFATVMSTMKKESAGKWTIQTIADKLLLNGLLENLGLPHMPMIFASRSLAKLRERLEVLVDKLIIATAKKQPYDIIVKPTHLSSAQGVMSFNKVHAPHREDTIRQLEKHMRKFIEAKAHQQESLALQSLKPGFIGQPKYKSVVGFKAPLELKVCALWGKVRSGVWWWGTRNAGPAEIPHRNVWIVRDPLVPGELSDNDGWEVLHNHPGGNAGFESAVKLFKRHMPEMAALTETLATALGTPFLRADFFVGSSKWGVRLNEVAYGCGLEYRNMLRDGATQRTIDDKPAMSEILRQGMDLCHQRLPPDHFLQLLGVQGKSYVDTAVVPLPCPRTNFSTTINSHPDPELQEYAVEENLCRSMKELPPHHEGELAKENVQSVQVPPHIMCKTTLVKPHPVHIPTLMMPNLQPLVAVYGGGQTYGNAAHYGGVQMPTTAMKVPQQVLPLHQGAAAVNGACMITTQSRGRPPAIMLRGPLR